MGVCRRTALYLARKKGKAFLLFLIFFLVSALLLICFSVLDGTGQAARLCFGLVKNHPFLDGNKRIGVHIALVFLALNGVELQYSQVELSDVILRLAAGEMEAGDLLHWILEHQGSR